MCAIVDNDVQHQVFNPKKQTPAGRRFLDWLDKRHGKLVIGGKLRRELVEHDQFRKWFQQAILSSNVIQFDDQKVDDIAVRMLKQHDLKSDDEHTLALAKISGARLLFTEDRDLMTDFRNKLIIDSPRGRIYSTVDGYTDVRSSHIALLNRNDLCRKLCESR